MSQPDERRRLEEELARLKDTPSPEIRLEAGATVPRSRHPQFERVLARLQREAEEIVDLFNPEIRVDVAPSVIPAPQVTVEASVVPAPQVRVDVPDQSAAIAQLAAGLAQIVELLGAWYAHETAVKPAERKEVTFKRNGNGQITGATVTEN